MFFMFQRILRENHKRHNPAYYPLATLQKKNG